MVEQEQSRCGTVARVRELWTVEEWVRVNEGGAAGSGIGNSGEGGSACY